MFGGRRATEMEIMVLLSIAGWSVGSFLVLLEEVKNTASYNKANWERFWDLEETRAKVLTPLVI